jgi:hypothetical protein
LLFAVATVTFFACAFCLALATAEGLIAQTRVPCGGQLYTGFDSRLSVDALGRLPSDAAPVVGLEVDRDQIFAATPTKLFLFQKDKPTVSSALPGQLMSMAIDEAGTLLLQFGDSFRTIPRGSQGVREWTTPRWSGQAHGSGATSFLEIVREPSGAALVVRRPADLAPLPFVRLPGALGPAAWTQSGLVAVLDQRVVELNTVTSHFTEIGRDAGYTRARDLTVLQDGRVVLALDKTLVLIGTNARLILAGFSGRVRAFESGIVAVDEASGFLWHVNGLGNVGEASLDQRHAQELLTRYRQTRNRQLALEAARIVGCSALEDQ